MIKVVEDYFSGEKILPEKKKSTKTHKATVTELAYEDRFISSDKMIALSKHPRKVNSSDADHFFKRTVAVICDSIENKTKIFSTARGYGEFKGGCCP